MTTLPCVEGKMVTICTIVSLLNLSPSSSHASSVRYESPFYQVPFMTLNVTAFKIVRDEFSSASEEYIVGARNNVFAINSSLSIVKSLNNGPVKDNPSCKPSEAHKCTSQIETDQDNRVILIDYTTKPNPSIVTCGTVKQGMCRLIAYSNFDTNLGFFGIPEDPTNYIASFKKTITVSVPYSTPSEHTIFIIAHEYDNRKLELSPPLLTARRIEGKPKPSFAYSHSENTNSSIDVRLDMKRSYPVNWIYGFHDDKYIYVISNQKISRRRSDYTARIGRICKNDPTLRSYTEIPIYCRVDSTNQDYKLSTAAHFGPLSEKLATKLGEKSGIDYLFITFSAASSELRPNHHLGSVVCGISTSNLTNMYRETTESCFLGDSGTAELHEAFSKKDVILCKAHRIGTENCGQSSYNQYIVRKQPIIIYPILFVPKATISSIITYSEKSNAVALLGSESGEIMKTSLDTSTILYRQSFHSPNHSYHQDRQVRAEPVLSANSEDAYFAVGNRVIKFPTKSCKIYSNCSSCLQTTDSLGCGWCGTYCAAANECTTKPANHCSPVIYSFDPKTGPLDGGTDLTIRGDNFGSNRRGLRNNVQLVSTFGRSTHVYCDIINWNNTVIQCKTPRVSHSDMQLQVRAEDHAGGYLIDGTFKSSESFVFMEPSVNTITPNLGPRFGGVNITIEGDHLDIGSSRKVLIVDKDAVPVACDITSVSNKSITCDTLVYNGSAKSGKFKIEIDRKVIATNIEFLFASDPIITKIYPAHITLASNGSIYVTGMNLNSTADPRLKINGIEYPCVANSSLQMKCKQPDDENLLNLLGQALPVSFTNGGNEMQNLPDNLNITVHPEPQFHSFSTREIIYRNDPKLDIRGENLNSQLDIKIKVGNYSCKIIPEQSEKNRIKCMVILPAPLKVNDSLNVSYSLGDSSEVLGRVVVEEKPHGPISLSYIIAISAVVFVAVVVFISGFLFFRSKFKKNKKAKEAGAVSFVNRPVCDGYVDGRSGDETDSYQPLNCSLSSWDDDVIAEFSSRSKLIAQEHLHINHEIGSGNFGSVFEGRLLIGDRTIPVAVKTPRRLDGPQELRTFLDEALTMRDLDHENVITLIGLVFLEKNKPGLVLPYMCNGDVLTYVRDSQRNPRIRDFINFQLDIARGMQYLSLQKFVHRDLAARNCMLDENLRVHVADFGLSKDIYEKGYYKPQQKTALPIRWMAPESIQFSSFTEKSDVWSFGVTSWEICTRGIIPYPGLQNQQLGEYLKHGNRLPLPDQCPPEIYNMWLDCWEYDAKLRPNFSVIVERIETFLEEHSGGEGEYLDATYSNLSPHSYYNNQINTESVFQPQKGVNFVTKMKGAPPPLPPAI